MFKKVWVIVAIALSMIVTACNQGSGTDAGSAANNEIGDQPALVVSIVVDGLSMETPLRYYDQLSEGGFRRLLLEGAWFSNAHHRSGATWTGEGHTTILTGAYSRTHGVVSDGWVDSETGSPVEPYMDPNYPVLGVETSLGYSPLHNQVSNVPDELRRATNFRSRVISVAANDKASVAHGGRLGTAYWLQGGSPPFDLGTEHFVTSTYYQDSYPEWWEAFHEGTPADAYFGEWVPLLDDEAYALAAPDDLPYYGDWLGFGTQFPLSVTGGLDSPGSAYYVALAWSPFAHDFTVDFVKAAIEGENLGSNEHAVPDFLSVGFPSYDFVKHIFGPEAKQSVDAFLRTDRALEELLDFLDEEIGLENVLVTFAADHGPGTNPDFASDALGFEASRINVEGMVEELSAHLASVFGDGSYVMAHKVPYIYLDYEFIEGRQLTRQEVENEAASFLSSFPGIDTVFTRTQLSTGDLPDTRLAQQAVNSWDPNRSGDLYLIQQPFWYYWDFSLIPGLGAMHGGPWSYDTHVPMVILGDRWVVPGEYKFEAEIVDLAPTLANILRIAAPAGSEGRVLHEALR